ncbi:MAG: hypothetical protein JOZ96_17380 [Acidobacteria bacterium]|nr:hypothetical protein [Acidobacteriota bacterium]
MQRFSVRLLVALLAFLTGVAAVAVWLSCRETVTIISDSQQVLVITPVQVSKPSQPKWGHLLYPYLEKHTSLAGLAELRSTPLPRGDLEVRVWYGFGLTALEGFVLRRADGQWSALHLQGDAYYEPKRVKVKRLPPPRSGWDSAWERLLAAGIRTLPDSSEIDYDTGGTDGWAYLVELREGDSYRAFNYQIPEYSRRPEARHVLEIGNAVGEEFRLPDFKEVEVPGR